MFSYVILYEILLIVFSVMNLCCIFVTYDIRYFACCFVHNERWSERGREREWAKQFSCSNFLIFILILILVLIISLGSGTTKLKDHFSTFEFRSNELRSIHLFIIFCSSLIYKSDLSHVSGYSYMPNECSMSQHDYFKHKPIVYWTFEYFGVI